MPTPTITLCRSDAEIQQILELQTRNLEKNITATEAKSQGYVTLVHTLPLLKDMNDATPHIIAKRNNKVVGYALAMLKDFAHHTPVLAPMVERINRLDYDGISLKDSKFLIMGQVCIDKSCRGMGIFDKLYLFFKKHYGTDYDFLITEVASRNTRSSRAHSRVGFKILEEYPDPTNGELWEFVVLKLK